MGIGLRTTVAVVGAMALVLGGCGSGAGEAGGSGSVAPPSASSSGSVAPPSVAVGHIDVRATALRGSGWTLFGVPRVEQYFPEWTDMVTDGKGFIWLLGPWQLVRLDPGTGEATAWDAAEDLQFASTKMRLAPASGPGVWLMVGARVRLFDGERFAVDLELPAEVRNVQGGPESDGWVTDVVQVGADVWVSVADSADIEDGHGGCCSLHPGSGGRVARYSSGAWTSMSAVEDGIGGSLAVDRDGALWAGGVVIEPGNAPPGRVVGRPSRWDGDRWSLPGVDDPDAPAEAGELVADPTGGVWSVSGADGLRRFDGTAWTAPAPNLNAQLNWFWTPPSGKLVAASDGAVWVAARQALARIAHDGGATVYGQESGFEGVIGLAIGAREIVVILDNLAVRRLNGARFQQIWEIPLSGGWGEGYGVSADELWVEAQNTWFRLRDGVWDELGAGSYCPSAVATDGALWTTTEDASVDYPGGGQLARISSDGYGPVGDHPVACGYGASLSAGPDGSVWVLQDGDVVQYWPDGRHVSIGRPPSVDPPPDPDEWGSEAAEQVCLHGVDPAGSVWVSEWSEADDEECTAGTWHRWEGQRWIAADEPDPFTSAQEHVVASDGIGWVLRGVGGYPVTGTEIARYVRGELHSVATRPRLANLTAVSGGRACAFEYGEVSSIVCVDADGEVARFDVTGQGVGQYSVAPDGSVWLLGPQAARLPQTLPGS